MRSGLPLLVLVTFACFGGAAARPTSPPTDRNGARTAPVAGDIVPDTAATLSSSVVRDAPAAIESAERHHERATVSGEATYYADKFEGRRTASGLRFRQKEMYAAHRTFPFGTVLRVTNERNGRSVIVRVVDRGPWGAVAKRRNTIIDISRSAAERLGFIRAGRAPVLLEVLLLGSGV